jgi:hypothetical protein
MDQLSINERINNLIKKFSNGKKKDFANSIELPESTLSGIVGTRGSTPGADILQKILIKYPNVNAEWLILGIEPMQKDDIILLPEPKENSKVKELQKLIETQSKTIDAQERLIDTLEKNQKIEQEIHDLTKFLRKKV